MKKIIRISIWSLLALFLIRIFVFQGYNVESFSMSSSLLPGDKVLVNKIKTGSRFPTTVLSLPGAERSYLDAIRIPYFRIPGIRKFKNDDVVVFNDPRSSDIPIDKSNLIISRIAGIPGDTLTMLNKELFILEYY